MTNSEKGLEFDQAVATRTLSPVSQHRVILRLTGIGEEAALERGDSYRFNRVLKGDKKVSAHELIYKQGAYFLDFAANEGEEADGTLIRAVGAIDEALLETQLQAELSGAWAMPAEGPRVGQVTTEWKEAATEVTQNAQALFDLHREEFIEAAALLLEQNCNYDSLLFQANPS
ncbi:MAG: hypothetical protein ABI602_03505 [Candidatus Saccharibacteria bacterium]